MMDIQSLALQVRQPGWRAILSTLATKYADDINTGVNASVLDVFPPCHLVFDAFNHSDINDLKVIIIGQDVYQNPGLANGLAFSVPGTATMPPSLKNIFKELEAEYGIKRTNTELYDWANQGVLLLNRALTVQHASSNSHARYWLQFTEDLIKEIHNRKKHVVYMLWGCFAQNIAPLIDPLHNLVLTWSHPSPLSRKPFVGNNHFTLANEYLEKNGKASIDWYGT